MKFTKSASIVPACCRCNFSRRAGEVSSEITSLEFQHERTA